jgi:uncharacterized integral membrane protein (TIGR00698 family)
LSAPTRAASLIGIAPGLAITLVVAVIARLLHGFLPQDAARLVGEVILAILLGLILGNTMKLPAVLNPGIRFSFQSVLRFAIVILGARFSFAQVVAIGGKALVMIVALMLLALAVAHGLGRWAGIPRKLSTLIGVGTAVCGNSAISATAPVIRARDEDVSFAIATNTLFGTLAVFIYPLLAHSLGLSDSFFGTWAGTAVNDTSQVVATGFAFSDSAGQVATTVKLTRNALMGFVIVAMGFLYSRGEEEGGIKAPFFTRLKQSVPGFVVGFLVMALLNTLGVLSWPSEAVGRDLANDFKLVAKFFILTALAGVGLGTKLATMRKIGPMPFFIGLATALTTAVASYGLIVLLGPAGE